MMRLAIALCLAASETVAQDASDASGGVLRGLDKVSGITQDIEIRAGGRATFGRMEIEMSACRYPTNDPSSNAFAHLTIRDGLTGSIAFDGWMIASSPALNALDHPRFDIWVLRCNSPVADGASD